MTKRKNGFEDSDCQQQIEAVETLVAEKASIMAEAAARCSGIAKRIQNEIKTAKALGVPTKSFKTILRVRVLERKIKDATADVPEDEIELYEDMAGQFSIFAPAPGEKPSKDTTATKAAKKVKAAQQANHDAEQAEGAEALDSLAAVH